MKWTRLRWWIDERDAAARFTRFRLVVVLVCCCDASLSALNIHQRIYDLFWYVFTIMGRLQNIKVTIKFHRFYRSIYLCEYFSMALCRSFFHQISIAQTQLAHIHWIALRQYVYNLYQVHQFPKHESCYCTALSSTWESFFHAKISVFINWWFWYVCFVLFKTLYKSYSIRSTSNREVH